MSMLVDGADDTPELKGKREQESSSGNYSSTDMLDGFTF